jgi:hypothetical protein
MDLVRYPSSVSPYNLSLVMPSRVTAASSSKDTSAEYQLSIVSEPRRGKMQVTFCVCVRNYVCVYIYIYIYIHVNGLKCRIPTVNRVCASNGENAGDLLCVCVYRSIVCAKLLRRHGHTCMHISHVMWSFQSNNFDSDILHTHTIRMHTHMYTYTR